MSIFYFVCLFLSVALFVCSYGYDFYKKIQNKKNKKDDD